MPYQGRSAPLYDLKEPLSAGVSDRMTRIHFEDAIVRINKAIGT